MNEMTLTLYVDDIWVIWGDVPNQIQLANMYFLCAGRTFISMN